MSLDLTTIRYGKASTGEIAVVLEDVASGLRRQREGVKDRATRESMRWAADFLDAIHGLMQDRFAAKE